jgi:4-hydroxybenzoyl-CoA thioesterase
MPFRCRIPVRFGDVDYAKIVYYPRFLHFCHVAMEEMFAGVVGVPYHEAIQREKVGYPTVRVEADYRLPVGFGETIEMSVVTERVGEKSVSFRYEGRRSSDGALAFVVRNTAVAVRMDAWKSVAIPPHHRKGFEALADPVAPAPAPPVTRP